MKNILPIGQLLKGAAFIIGIGGSTYAYAMFQGGFVSWFLFYSVLPFLIYMIALFFYPLSDIKAERKIEKVRYIAGEKMTVHIELERRIPFPLYYVIVKEGLPPSLRQEQPKKMRFLWITKTLRYSYSIEQMPRGDHRLLHLTVKTGDMLGLVEKEKRLFTQNSILVYPHIEKVFIPKEIKSAGERRSNTYMFAGENRSLTASIRAYQAGDRFSWIDWKTTARKNELMTREFEKEENQSYMLYLDRSILGSAESFEKAVVYATSFARAVIHRQLGIGLISMGENRAVFSVAKGEQHFQSLYTHFAAVQADAAIPFAAVLKQESANTPTPRIIHVLVLQELSQELVQYLQTAAASGRCFLVIVASADPAQTFMIQTLKKFGIVVHWLKGEETLSNIVE